MPRGKSKRENMSATTFWMNIKLKKEAQEKARRIDITLTDLINRAVEFYLAEGHKLDDEFGRRLAVADLAEDIREAGKYDLKIAQMETDIKGMSARISTLESQIDKIFTGDELQAKIRAIVSAKVDPLIEKLYELAEYLNRDYFRSEGVER